MSFKNLLVKIKKSVFLKNTFILLTGGVAAQVIPLLLMPLLTRIYSPSQFGLLALFVSISAIMYVGASLRYEMAIILPKEQQESLSILGLSVHICLATSIFCFFVFLFASSYLAVLLGGNGIQKWLILVSFSMLLMGMYRIFMAWFNRNQEYKLLSFAKIIQHGGTAVIQIFLSGFKGGLIAGYISGLFLSTFFFIICFFKKMNSFEFLKPKKDKLKIAKKYSKFPKYSLIGAFADNAGAQVPILVLGRYFAESVVGIFSLANRMVTAPLLLITMALGQVVFQKVSEMSHNNPKSIRPFVIKGVVVLAFLFSPLVPIMYFWGRDIFSLVFGAEWADAGHYAIYLSIAAVFKLSVSPFSTVLLLEKNIKLGVVWQILYLFTVSITLILFSQSSIDTFLIAFSVHEIMLYALYFLIIIVATTRV